MGGPVTSTPGNRLSNGGGGLQLEQTGRHRPPRRRRSRGHDLLLLRLGSGPTAHHCQTLRS
eukprot:9858482-Alexandrium_andersonii.AAC.1